MTEEDIQARWEENRQAVQDAKEAVLGTFRVYSEVRARVSAAARHRNPIYPVLNAGEQADVDRARGVWSEAKVTLAGAQVRFKAGVEE